MLFFFPHLQNLNLRPYLKRTNAEALESTKGASFYSLELLLLLLLLPFFTRLDWLLFITKKKGLNIRWLISKYFYLYFLSSTNCYMGRHGNWVGKGGFWPYLLLFHMLLNRFESALNISKRVFKTDTRIL